MISIANSLTNLFHTIYSYDKWKLKIILSIIISYATYYITRLNFSFAMPSLIHDLGFTKTELGFVLSSFSIIYGLGKFFSGIVSDITSAKKTILAGLLGTAIVNLIIPHITAIYPLALAWGVNGCFQSMGWPPCVKLINNWFSKKEIGTVWGLCNSAHAIGSSLIALFAGIILSTFGLRSLFYLPSLIAIIVLLTLKSSLNEYPKHLLTRNQIKEDNDNPTPSFSYRNAIFDKLLKNPVTWSMALGTMFLYVIRIGLLNWLPTFLIEQNQNMGSIGWQFSGLEALGIFGGIFAGYFSDKVGYTHRSRVAMVFMLGLIICLAAFLILPFNCYLLKSIALILCGFFVYGPQVLAGIIANDYVSKPIAAAVTGFVGTFGYIGATFAGIGLGFITDRFGWKSLFITLFINSLVCFLCFLIASNTTKKEPA